MKTLQEARGQLYAEAECFAKRTGEKSSNQICDLHGITNRGDRIRVYHLLVDSLLGSPGKRAAGGPRGFTPTITYDLDALDSFLNGRDLLAVAKAFEKDKRDRSQKDSAPEARVSLGSFGKVVLIDGKPKALKSYVSFKLIKNLVEARPKKLTKTAMEAISRDYWRILKNLKSSDPDWDSVLHFGGKKGGGYWID